MVRRLLQTLDAPPTGPMLSGTHGLGARARQPVRRIRASGDAGSRSRADPGRARHSRRRIPAALLAAGGLHARSGRPAAPRAHPGRRSRRLPRSRRAHRRAPPALRASRHVARVRHSARARPALLLPRLGVRRGRALSRDTRRARGQSPVRARVAGRVSHARVLRARLRVSGPARPASRVPALRQLRGAGPHAHARGRVHAAVQLAPGEGQQHGPGAHRVPARALERLPVHRGLRRGAGARLAPHRRGHGLHRDPSRA